MQQELRVALYFDQVVCSFPNEWNALELSQGVALRHLNTLARNDLSGLGLRVCLCQQEVENQRFEKAICATV